MAGRIWRREQHVARILRRRRQHHVHPYWGYGMPAEYHDAWPRRRWHHLGRFESEALARQQAQRHIGSVVEPVYRWRGKRQSRVLLAGFRVGYSERLGAPFRTPVMSWALEEAVQRHQHAEQRKWLSRGGLKGGVSDATRASRRLWRRSGREVCRLANLGALDCAEELDPQPKRLGVLWLIW